MMSAIKSRPVYAPIQPVVSASQHRLVLEGAALQHEQLSQLANVFAAYTGQLQTWAIGSIAALPLPGGVVNYYGSLDEANSSLLDSLRDAPMSLRLYVMGTEPFIWSVALLAQQAGLTASQLQLSHAGSLKRRVWCTHCHQMTEDVTTNITVCAGCGRHLLVRDHFSKRLGAFMGVQIDAECPGVLPPIEEVYP